MLSLNTFWHKTHLSWPILFFHTNMKTTFFQESVAAYDEQGYVGFGFDGWQSGVQSFPDIAQVSEFTNYLPRNFPVGKLERLLTSSLKEMENAISIEKKN